ncbi:N-acetylmuramoyl-L-alanine amidase [Peribacillus sp. SCS-155]|uniref:N-acetylmuramoyl-L-alanine amidase n=1 Tax=Peribacillus sedimenti TaxID=3115297 RepID=UPI00390697CD
MKNKYQLVVVAAVLMLVLSIMPRSTEAATIQKKVSVDVLNMRSGPSTGYSVIYQLKKGQIVNVAQEQNGWSKITYGSRTGWVASQYLSHITWKGYVSASALNLRKSASTTSTIIATLPKGTFVNVEQQGIGWLKVYVPSKGLRGWVSSSYITKVRIKGKVIVLDPGHGGVDGGASGSTHLEKELNLRTVKELAILFRQAGATVILTREDDRYLSLQERVDVSEKYNADAFISIHYNSAGSTASGVMSFYYDSSKDQELAKYIQEGMVKETGMKDMGVRYGNFYVLRENSRPSVLLELGFLSNPTEEKKIATITYQRNVSRGIFIGVNKYFSVYK